jgi:adenylate cyclase, class 2
MKLEEREIKYYIDDLDRLRERLRICGAEQVQPRTFELNLRLDTPDHQLADQGILLRLRKDSRSRVTYKDSGKAENGIIARREIEFSTDDFEITRKLFEALGYQVMVTYEKYRETYILGDVEIALDEMPFGTFTEIEAPNNSMIDGASQMLGLDPSKGTAINYLGLFAIAKEKFPLDFEDLTFDNFKFIKISLRAIGLQPADKP